MANAERKTWIHGFFQNTFNAETGNWQLRDSRNEALIAEGPKAAKIGKLGAAMTRSEKAWDKVRNLERQLELAQAAYGKAHRVMSDLSLDLDMEERSRATWKVFAKRLARACSASLSAEVSLAVTISTRKNWSML